MKEIIIDTIIDALKLLPFLFITFVLLEYIYLNNSVNLTNTDSAFSDWEIINP